MYFESFTEADLWLPFDSEPQMCENYSYWYPDTFEEWRRWREDARNMNYDRKED